MSPVRLRVIVAALCPAVALVAAASAPAAKRKRARAAHAVTIKVVSGRADLVSGGDALVAIGGVASTAGLKGTPAGREQTSAVGVGPGRRGEGVGTGVGRGPRPVIGRPPRGAPEPAPTKP